ncbi:Energy conserving hydrogenase Eha transmembrane protein E [Methanocaldococcus lauensis]|nr:Energy conserving hydrogenase Eha transmembrane protein E [Methanocaldococcus lauensis]
MEYIEYLLYLSYVLLIIGTIGAIVGPKSNDRLIRLLNTEVATFGVCFIFLAYDEALALMTFIAVNAILSLILVRAIIQNEEYEKESDIE